MGIHVFPGWNTRRASMIHIDDFVAAVVLAADQGERLPKHRSADNLGHGVYFVGDTRQPTYAGLGQIIAQAVGRKRVVNCRVPNAAARMVGLVAEGINQVRGRQTLLNHDKAKEFVAPNWTADVTKIHQQLGFRPAKSLDARWAEAIATYRGRRGAASSADAEAKVNADAQLETKSA
jgi:nucleoside-diphosphate-sugar epimerase